MRFLLLTILLTGCSLGEELGTYTPGVDIGLSGAPDAGADGAAGLLDGPGDDTGDPACPPGQMVCGDGCTDVRSDPYHCGSCSPCPVVQGASARCLGGTCDYLCAEDFEDVDGDLSSGESGTGCECPGAEGCPGDCTRNACGGCGPLPATEGSACGSCGEWTCSDTVLVCNDAGENACGGCGPLSQTPGVACGGCGVWTCQGEQVACVDETHPELGCPLLHATLDDLESVRVPRRGAGEGEVVGGQFVAGQIGNAYAASATDYVRFPQAGTNGTRNIDLRAGALSVLFQPAAGGRHHLMRVNLNDRYELRIEYDDGLHGKIFDTYRRVAVSQSWFVYDFPDNQWTWLVFSWDLNPGQVRPWGVWFVNGRPQDSFRWHQVITPAPESSSESIFVGAWHPSDSDGAQGMLDDFRIFPRPVH